MLNELSLVNSARQLIRGVRPAREAVKTHANTFRITAATTGFLYYVPQLGITGLSLSITESVKASVRKIKTLTDNPVCIGLGVETREDVSSLYEAADGVIVGTSIVEHIEAHRDQGDIGSLTARFVKALMPRTD